MLFAAPVVAMQTRLVVQTQHLSSQTITSTARDPGVRGGAAGAGGALQGLSSRELAFFESGKEDFAEVEEVDEGLGPRMNLDGCGGCHAQPAIGGSSPAVNPQFAFATAAGAGGDKGAAVHHRQWPGARSTVRTEPRRLVGRRRDRALHHHRPRRSGGHGVSPRAG